MTTANDKATEDDETEDLNENNNKNKNKKGKNKNKSKNKNDSMEIEEEDEEGEEVREEEKDEEDESMMDENKEVVVLITGSLNDNGDKLAEMGAILLNDYAPTVTHLVSDVARRTLKFIAGMAHAKYMFCKISVF